MKQNTSILIPDLKGTKEIKQSFTPRQQKLYDFLSQGGKYSVMDIANALYIGDPRSAIRDLRNKGVNVCDEWKNGVEGKYKLYFITKGDCNE